MSELKAVLWDLDGTLIDSEGPWFVAIQQLVAAYGLEWTDEDRVRTIGQHLPDSAAELRLRGVDLPADVIIERLSDQVSAWLVETQPFAPGALALVAGCAEAGLMQGLVTMSYRRMVDPLVAVVHQSVPGGFGVVVTGDAVSRGKPFPDPYWQAVSALGLTPADCLAIEDSPTGVASALAAGVTTVAVPGPAEIVVRPRLSRVPSLADLDVARLRSIHSGQAIDWLADAGAAPAG